MKTPRPPSRTGRKRLLIGRCLLCVGGVLAVVWAASAWFRCTLAHDRWAVTTYEGLVCISEARAGPSQSDFQLRQRPRIAFVMVDRQVDMEMTWNGRLAAVIDWRSENRTMRWFAFVVLWPIILLVLAPAALLLRSGILARRRAMKGMCTRCGYSLNGLAPEAPCPECGKGTPPTA